MFYKHFEILNTFMKEKYNFNKNTFVTVITEISIGHVQKTVMFCVNKTISQLFQNRISEIVEQYYSRSLELFILMQIFCSGFFVI